MVKVCWEMNTGELRSVSGADGPGRFTDDPDTNTVKEILESSPCIGEDVIAEAVIRSYDGELLEYNCHVTADTFGPASDLSNILTTVAFVEIHKEEDRLNVFECDSCKSENCAGGDWEFEVRKEDGWVYHDLLCPQCSSIVNTDLVEVPQPKAKRLI